MDSAGTSIENERAPYVLDGRVFAQTDPGVVNLLSRIDARAAKPQAEGARKRRLGPAGIGGGVSARIAPHDAARRYGRRTGDEQCRDDNPYDGKPRRGPIDKIVKFCRGETERLVPLRAMADHAVGGVDRLVANTARKAAKREPECWRHDTIRKILGEALDRRAGDASLIETRNIAADDFCCRRATGVQSRVESLRNGKDMRIETALRDEAGRGKRRERKANCARKPGKTKVEKGGGAPSEC